VKEWQVIPREIDPKREASSQQETRVLDTYVRRDLFGLLLSCLVLSCIPEEQLKTVAGLRTEVASHTATPSTEARL